jgi:hypothetical protein
MSPCHACGDQNDRSRCLLPGHPAPRGDKRTQDDVCQGGWRVVQIHCARELSQLQVLRLPFPYPSCVSWVGLQPRQQSGDACGIELRVDEGV